MHTYTHTLSFSLKHRDNDTPLQNLDDDGVSVERTQEGRGEQGEDGREVSVDDRAGELEVGSGAPQMEEGHGRGGVGGDASVRQGDTLLGVGVVGVGQLIPNRWKTPSLHLKGNGAGDLDSFVTHLCVCVT